MKTIWYLQQMFGKSVIYNNKIRSALDIRHKSQKDSLLESSRECVQMMVLSLTASWDRELRKLSQ